jgi:WD40 repeat protein
MYLNSKGRVCIPEKYSIEMGSNEILTRIIGQPDLFNTLSSSIKKAMLDILFLLLNREPCDAVRLEYVDELAGNTESQGLCRMFLKLLSTTMQDKSMISLSKRLIHLIGLAASLGISSTDMRKILMLLRSPSELSLPLLQSIQIMIRNDVGVNKANPPSFFNFGGHGAGLGTVASAFPFSKEYQFVTWFRVEKFHESDAAALSDDCQHILTWQNPSHRGLDIFFENSTLVIAVCQTARVEPIVYRLPSVNIKRGVWYHLNVRHSKPNKLVALFSNEELSISLDDEIIFTEAVKFPNLGNFADTEFFMGKNMNGQMGPIYFFHEALSAAAVSAVSKLDSGRGFEGISNTSDAIPTDLLKGITTATDKKFHPILSKIAMSYHPLRCYQGWVIDPTSGRHATMGTGTQPWNVVNPRDLFATMGGINCLLPLFPRLLIEAGGGNGNHDGESTNNSKRSTPVHFVSQKNPSADSMASMSNTSNLLGTSLSEMWDDEEDLAMVLDTNIQQLIRQRKEELVGDGCLSLLLTILGKSIINHKQYQQELFFKGGVEMIEYAVGCIPSELLVNESEKCVLALLQLKNSAVDIPALEWRITKSLMCNVELWYAASFPFLSSLMSVMLASLKAKPDIFLKLIGVQMILDGLEFFVSVEDTHMNHSKSTKENIPGKQAENECETNSQGSLIEENSETAMSSIASGPPSNFDSQIVTPIAWSPKSPTPITPSTSISRNLLSSVSTGQCLEIIVEESDDGESSGKIGGGSIKLFSPIPTGTPHSSDASGTTSAKKRSNFMDFKNPRTSITAGGLKSSIRKLKSFKLALSERLQDDDEEDFEAEAELLESSHQDLLQLLEASEKTNSSGGGVVGPSSSKKERRKSTLRLENPAIMGLDGIGVLDMDLSPINPHPTTVGSPDKPMGTAHDGDVASVMSESIYSPQTNAQRKQIREFMESMLVILLLQGSSEKEMIPFLDYIATCKDKVVVNELAQILLFLIMEGGPKIITAVVAACNGIEEFAAFILLYLVHQPLEELRYSGIRILTHFYARVDQASSTVLNMSLRRKKKSLAKALGGGNTNLGLQRLQLCGGMALLCELISAHCKYSTELTYAALLEMLLTKPIPGSGKMNTMPVPLADLFDSTFAGGGGGSNSQAVRQRTASFFNSPTSALNAAKGQVQFVAHYLSMDRFHDESDMTNNLVLPLFFELIPKLPTATQEQIYTDLLALLKHSSGNRQAFYTCPSWHLCMFSLVSQQVDASHSIGDVSHSFIHTDDVVNELEIWNGTTSADSPVVSYASLRSRSKMNVASDGGGELLRTWNSISDIASVGSNSDGAPPASGNSSASSAPFSPAKTAAGIFQLSLSTPVSANKVIVDDGNYQKDLFFDLGMKIYSTLLLHAVENKYGWREVDLCVAPSLESEAGYGVVQSVVSHLLNELTFNMKSKYKELQKLVKSANSVENQLATDKLENVLSIFITSMQIALVDQRCVCPFENFQVNKLRAHYFSEFARELYLKKLETRGTTVDTKTMTQDYDIASFTQMEVRQLFSDAEVRLLQRLGLDDERDGPRSSSFCETIPMNGSIPPTLDGMRDECVFEEYMDFSHSWQDISSESNGQPGNRLKSGSMDSNSAPAVASLKSIEELLHPLGRVHDQTSGRLILILQALRFFDVLFWPHSDSPLRNIDMLRFTKDGLQLPTGVNKTDASKRGSGSGLDETTSGTANSTAARLQMSVFSAAMRMCIYNINNLSPITHLAVLNIKRLRAMIVSLDRISTYNTPTYDWMLAAVTHVTINIQRFIASISPIYAMLGFDGDALDFKVRVVGPWNDSFDEFDKLTNAQASKIYEAMDNRELKYKLQSYFNSSMGRNVIRNIRSSLRLLIDVFEVHSSKLALGLEERTYNALYVLIEQIKADAQIRPNISPTTSTRRPVMSISRQMSFKWEENSNNGSNPVTIDSNAALDEPVSYSRSASVSEQSDNSDRLSTEASGYDQTQPNSQQGASSNTEPVSFEEAFSGYDIILMMKWLLYPYFRRNPFRSVQVVKAIDALDYLEGRNVNKFMTECKVLKQSMEEHRDLAVKSVEEMTELKELSREVYEIMSERSELRFLQSRTQQQLKTKNVANRWHECLQEFEADWSPWRVDLNKTWTEILQGEEESAVAHYEVTKHRDMKMRNVLLTRLPEPINHKNAAYMESKLKDQMQYLLTHGDQSTLTEEQRAQALAVVNGGTGTEPNTSGRSSQTLKLTQPLVNTKGAGGGNGWDDIDDIDDDTKTVDSESNSTLTGGLASIATFFQGQERRPTWTYLFNWGAEEKILLSFEVTQIQVDQAISGILLLTNKCIYFHCKKRINPNSHNQSKPFFDRRWFLDRLVEAYGRRYLLQNCAIELFFADSPEVFFAFRSLGELQKFFRVLRNQPTPLLSTPRTLNPRHSFRNSPWTELWRKRLITNFEYLMRLNIIAGRSYNDITQYPVFPWVLADYSSTELNLKDSKVYRKLHLPVGALNPTRLQEFLDRYKSFDDETVPKFMYGSHYSSAGVIMHYMIRQEPFTTLAIALQGGRFDCPDRLFFDIRRTWQGCNNSMSDVKELIPELFCCPEILINSNRLPLGELQEGGDVDHVVLPPWAKTPYDFIRINRDALESEYVSEHLHDWIDLIFGYKQTGQAAKDAHNIFYYLTYEGAINIEAIEDPLQREAAKAQVTHFGQTPSQLLQREHPRRLPKDECVLPLCANIGRIPLLRAYTPAGTRQIGRSHGPIIALRCVGDKIITFHSDFGIGYYRWIVTPDLTENLPFTIRIDKVKHLPSSSLSAAENLLRGQHIISGNSQIPPATGETIAGPEAVPPPPPVPSSSPAPQQGVLSSWKSALKGLTSHLGAQTRAEADKPVAGTLYNAMRIERKTRSLSMLTIDEKVNATPKSLLRSPRHGMPTTSMLSSFKQMSPNNVSIFLPDILAQGRIITCGYWDNTLKLHNLDTMKEVASSSCGHLGGITCMQQGSHHNNILITGGYDGSLRIWAVEKPSLASMFLQNHLCTETISDDMTSIAAVPDNIFSSGLECIHTLWGHHSPIQSISFSSDSDVILSGGSDGLLCLHTARQGVYIRSMTEMVGSSIDVSLAASSGYLLAHSWSNMQLALYWMNGEHLKTIQASDK